MITNQLLNRYFGNISYNPKKERQEKSSDGQHHAATLMLCSCDTPLGACCSAASVNTVLRHLGVAVLKRPEDFILVTRASDGVTSDVFKIQAHIHM